MWFCNEETIAKVIHNRIGLGVSHSNLFEYWFFTGRHLKEIAELLSSRRIMSQIST